MRDVSVVAALGGAGVLVVTALWSAFTMKERQLCGLGIMIAVAAPIGSLTVSALLIDLPPQGVWMGIAIGTGVIIGAIQGSRAQITHRDGSVILHRAPVLLLPALLGAAAMQVAAALGPSDTVTVGLAALQVGTGFSVAALTVAAIRASTSPASGNRRPIQESSGQSRAIGL